MPVGPLSRVGDGVVTSCVGRADDHQCLGPNGVFSEKGEKQVVWVLQVLNDFKHHNEVKTLWQKVFGALHQGHALAVALLGNTPRMVGGLNTKTLPTLVSGQFQVVSITTADVEYTQIVFACGKASD